ncbi:MAG TPA: MotA/TolQ/ExbB proton channel family protein [Nitrospiraceae bacterium]|nr:MotA/TolQ/ExbB proton channel family protein [Nitrospiraceae bacterium]
MFQSGPMLVGSLGAVSKIVLLFLFLFSVISWAVILYKWRVFKTADREDQRFFTAFTKIRDFEELYRQSKRAEGSPSARVFQGIMDRLWTPQNDGAASLYGQTSTGRESGIAVVDHHYIDKTVGYLVQNQISYLESYLPVLATTGNITPFIGLLGTVLGIIDSFREIGLQGTASIAAVAPGVSEALVATAAGLFTAIPAVIAYNYYLSRIRKTVFRVESFTVEVMHSLQARQKQSPVGVQG